MNLFVVAFKIIKWTEIFDSWLLEKDQVVFWWISHAAWFSMKSYFIGVIFYIFLLL